MLKSSCDLVFSPTIIVFSPVKTCPILERGTLLWGVIELQERRGMLLWKCAEVVEVVMAKIIRVVLYFAIKQLRVRQILKTVNFLTWEGT
jgi:hypothetical protein